MADINDAVGNLANAFEEFKSTNDARLGEIEKKGGADVLTSEKLDRINSDLSKLQSDVTEIGKKSNRIGASGDDQVQDEHKQAFNAWARKGNENQKSELESIERKAITEGGGDASGGLLFPKVVEAGVRDDLRTLSPIRSRATVVQVSSDDYRFLRNLRGLQTGWVAETAARPETATPTLSETRVPMGEIYANPAVSQRALDDAAFDLEGWLTQNISEEFAIEENKAFVSGDGVDKPKGILTTAGLTTIKTGSAAAMPTSSDFVFDMIYGLSAAYRSGAAFYANGATTAGLRKLKDGQGNYIWQPSLVAGTPAAMGGYEFIELEDQDAVAANKYPLMFANMKQGYLIADRIGIRTLRDPYTHKPFVHFYATKRVGGMVQDAKAFVLLKVSA